MAHWKLAFITGGGSGIGRRMAELLLAEGTSVAVFDRSNNVEAQTQLAAIAAAQPGVRCEFYRADVTDSAALTNTVAQAVTELGCPDFALNCAGIQIAKLFSDLSADEFSQVVAVNLLGSRNFAAATLPHMTAGGQFILIASLAGRVAGHSYSAYNASKHGVVGLAGALRLDYIASGIEVSVICPPEINTPMVAEERKTLSPVAVKLKDTAGTLQLNPACDYMLRKIRQRSYLIIPGYKARVIDLCARWFPGFMRWYSERVVIAETRRLAR